MTGHFFAMTTLQQFFFWKGPIFSTMARVATSKRSNKLIDGA